MQSIEQIIARWDSGEGKPYKGKLIDWSAYDGDGDLPPSDIGCMCAQGQVLHLLGGWSPRRLKDIEQRDADLETARLLDVSVTHVVLLRRVNDSMDGAPSIVLTHPEKILGDQAPVLLSFWKHIDRMTVDDWLKADAARDAAWDAAWYAAGDAAKDAAWDAAKDAAGYAARDAAWDAAWYAAGDAAEDAAGYAARDAARDAAWDAAGYAAGASNEIQGSAIMRKNNQPFFFLPMFGFASPEEIVK